MALDGLAPIPYVQLRAGDASEEGNFYYCADAMLGFGYTHMGDVLLEKSIALLHLVRLPSQFTSIN